MLLPLKTASFQVALTPDQNSLTEPSFLKHETLFECDWKELTVFEQGSATLANLLRTGIDSTIEEYKE